MRSLEPTTFLRRAVLLFISVFLSTFTANSSLPPDALSLLAFKSDADPHNNIPFPTRRNFSHCAWRGVQCGVLHGRVIRVVLEGLDLAGVFPPDTLTRLDQLRVLSLRNNSLTGPIPDLAGLVNLKALFLHHNRFSASVPPSISSLHRLRTLDLSYNNLSGTLLPAALDKLDRLFYLRLDFNRFKGSIPPFDQPSLRIFNVSGNNFTGAVPVTPALVRFGASSFSLNPGLCGEIVRKECRASAVPFFGNSSLAPPPAVVLGQSAQLQAQNSGVVGVKPPQPEKRKRIAAVIGFSVGVLLLITTSILIIMVAVKSQKKKKTKKETTQIMAGDVTAAADAAMVMRMEAENELEEKVRELQSLQMGRSGNLVFCAGETQSYSLDQLMRASAELLGRGKVGTTYKAVLDNRLIVCVKRLDSVKLGGTGKEGFERHMDSVGGLRHPNLVPLRAFFQAGEERLLVYDYQPNGSLFSLIHGSKSSRAKPLHWTSCLKIAEDVAQGLSYIHQAWRLVHGNLTSSNVLLGPDFEACLSDYCLSVLLAKPNSLPCEEDDQVCNPDSEAYKAPELSRKKSPEFTAKSDVYSFGVLLLELITGKIPSQHPPRMTMPPEDLIKWGRSTRTYAGDDANTADDRDQEINRLEMLLELSVACSATSPEQRPTMWQVLKMIQEIKEAAVMEDLDSLVDPPPTGSPEPR